MMTLSKCSTLIGQHPGVISISVNELVTKGSLRGFAKLKNQQMRDNFEVRVWVPVSLGEKIPRKSSKLSYIKTDILGWYNMCILFVYMI